MAATELLAFVRANLPAPPVRLLEIGAGDGALARVLAGAGYEVLAIDPEPAGADVRHVSLHDWTNHPRPSARRSRSPRSTTLNRSRVHSGDSRSC